MPSTSNLASEELLALLEDYHALNSDRVGSMPAVPSSLEFCKQVNKGLPCVYTVFTPASTLAGKSELKFAARDWSLKTLIHHVSEEVEVAVTPDGRADALCSIGDGGDSVFLQPASVKMRMEDFLARLCSQVTADNSPVYYLQSQNSNLTTTALAPLLQDIPTNFSFAEEVLGAPEAVNIWIGDERSVTSAHRDPYENLYLVLRGSKTFTLWPPIDEFALDAQLVRTGRYTYNSTKNAPGFDIVLDDGSAEETSRIPWVPIDPDLPRATLDTQHPSYRHARPRKVTISAGQMLYLPAGWYHHVRQETGTWADGSRAPCIAINYWYDQDYEGEKYVMRQLVGRLAQRAHEEAAVEVAAKINAGNGCHA